MNIVKKEAKLSASKIPGREEGKGKKQTVTE